MRVLIQVMDVNGRVLQVLENNRTKSAGFHEVNLKGQALQAGMYYVFLVTEEGMISKKVIVMR